MLRRASLLACLVLVGCGGSSFNVGAEGSDSGGGGEDTSTSADTGTVATDSGGGDDTSVPPDSGTTSEVGTPDIGTIESGPPMCGPVGPGATDIYVDARVATSGTGIFACPFKTILEALSVGKNASVVRTIHVAAGNYSESDLLHITSDVTVVSEGGRSKITGGSKSNCGGLGDKCVINIEGAGTLDGFDVEAGGIAFGIVAGGAARSSVIKNCSSTKANRVGLVVTGSLEAGPNLHVDDNNESNAWVRSGNLHVLPGTNSFDGSSGHGATIGGTFVPAGGIVVFNSATLNFEGGTASENQHGIIFDWNSSSTSKQSITGLTATANRGWGVSVPRGQKSFQLRKSTLTGNSVGGLYLDYDTTAGSTNAFDLGIVGDAGGNVFGGSGTKNVKVGVFLCHPPAVVSGEGDSFSVCPPSQVSVTNCDSMPASYADVAFTGVGSGSVGPLTDTTCTVGP